MAVQILGLRSYIDRNGKERKAEKFFEENWRAESIQWLFANIDSVLKNIPEDERWNLYYTAAVCKETKGRILESQNIIPFDIDDIDVTKINTYVNIVCKELDVDINKTGVVFTGNGLQLIVGIKQNIDDVGFFDRERHLYKAICGRINQALYLSGLEGKADTSVFSAGRLLRLPNTLNRKPNKPEREAKIIQQNIEAVDFDLSERTGLPKVEEGEHIHPKAYTKLPDPDPKGVLEGCDFLKYCWENAASISEPQWYAMLSIVGRLPDGNNLCHEFSKPHEGYDYDDTEFKYKQALEASGPRTCDNIDSLWDGCGNCPNRGRCKSPIMLRSESFIATKETGFYEMSIDKNGMEKRGKPSYDDLVKYFSSINPYTTMEVANIVHVFDGRKWVDISRNRIHNFAEVNFDPTPSNQMCTEFESKLKRTNIQNQDWYHVDGAINFNNGVLDLETMDIEDHNPEYGFKYVLPFDYDPNADCPRFKEFLKDVTLNRQDLSDVLVEFMGYSLAGVDPNLGQKALILYGDGSNGKSVFIEILRALAGQDNYSTLSMGNEINKLENRYQLSGKLFNVSEETPTGAMVESSIFKALVSGGEVQARKLYCDAFSMRNYAKIIMACNELPRTNDLSHGMLRRLLIVPFDATFTAKNRDIHIVEKLKEELSGIFNLAMEGYRRFIRLQGFTQSAVVDTAVTSYVEDNDSVQNFLSDECIMEPESVISSSKLYANYKFYCEQACLNPLNMIKFGKRLRQILLHVYNEDRADRYNINGRRMRGYKGITVHEGGTY
jgi:putative DNA primase/helicase